MHARVNILSASVLPSFPARIGRYEIKSPIGRGGMGNLYLAHDPGTNRLVAIKLLDLSLNSPEFRQRFVNEARALAAVNHPNIVDIYDTGDYEGTPYFVMEYVRGETLAEIIKRHAAGPITQRLKWMAELCAGLSQTHEAGVIHRDIKPANLIVDRQGGLKLLDFGIARVDAGSSTASLRLTRVHTAIGTPGYMSPEQLEGAEIDHRSDLFSAGAVCYELFTYKEAFPGRTAIEIERRVAACRPEPLTVAVPGLAPELDTIVLRALKKRPDRRYKDAAAFERDLQRLRARLEASGEPAPTHVTAQPAPTGRGKARELRAEAAYQGALSAYRNGDVDDARRLAVEALAEDPSHKEARALLAGLEPAPRRAVAPTAVPAPSLATVVTTSIEPSEPTLVDSSTDSFDSGTTEVAGARAVPEATDTWDTRSQPGHDARTIIVAPADSGRDSRHTRDEGTRLQRTPGGVAVQRARAWMANVTSSRSGLWKGSRAGVLLLVAAIGLVVLLVTIARALPSLWSRTGPLLTVERPVNGTLVTAGGIRCGSGGSDCTLTMKSGEAVEFVAQADDGYVFSGYTGNCSAAGRLTMNGPQGCGAIFRPVTPPEGLPSATHRMTISPVPTGGTIESVDIKCGSQGSACAADYPQGEMAILKAIADDGYTFMGFTGNCGPTGQVLMSNPQECGAKFERTTVLAETRPTGSRTLPTRSGNDAGGSRRPSDGTPAATPGSAGSAGAASAQRGQDNPGGGAGVNPQGNPNAPVPNTDTHAPPTAEEYAKGQIKEVLARWCSAYEDKNPDTVLQVYPRANKKVLEDQFRQYRSIRCAIGEITYKQLDTAAGKAQVQTEVAWVYDYTVTKKEESKQIAGFTLGRAQQRTPWVIEGARFQRK
jgi:hypothetical protein